MSELDAYARLGNLVLGTALLAAAYIAVLQLVVRDQPLPADFATRVPPEPGVPGPAGAPGVAEPAALPGAAGSWPRPAEPARLPARPG